jgi:hypothetical protein
MTSKKSRLVHHSSVLCSQLGLTFPSGKGASTNMELSTDTLLSPRSQIVPAYEHLLHDADSDIDELALFFRLLEWMEIEDVMIKSYGELRLPSCERIFRTEELETVDRVLGEVDTIVTSLMGGFFKEFNFACGVLNSLLVTYVFAAYPQHFWLLYMIEGLYLLPRNLIERIRAKPLNRVFSYLDYCWMMNIVALLSLICLVFHTVIHLPISDAVRKQLFVFTIGTACGPLMGAAIVLPFVALLFHNIDTMTGLFIHIFPPMVAFTLRWYPEQVHEAWPNVFKLDYLSDVHYFLNSSRLMTFDTVSASAIAGYFAWLIPYTIWMILFGLKLPRKDRIDRDGNVVVPKYDTCFNITMRGGGCLAIGKTFWGRSKAESLRQMETNHFEAKDLLVYMAIHAAMSVFAILFLGYMCYSSQAIHGSFLVLLAVLCAFRGAKRYTYYTTSMYSRMLRKHFALLSQVNGHSDH